MTKKTTQEFHVNPNRIRQQSRLFITSIGLSTLMIFISIYLILYFDPKQHPDILKMIAVSDFLKMILAIIVIGWCLVPTVLFLHRNYGRLGRIWVNDQEIRIYSKLPGCSGRERGLKWQDLSKVEVIERLGIVQLYSNPSLAQSLSLRVADWIPIEQSEIPAASKLRASPLWNTLKSIDYFQKHLH